MHCGTSVDACLWRQPAALSFALFEALKAAKGQRLRGPSYADRDLIRLIDRHFHV